MKISKLNIKNFKGIVDANISLGDLTIITGKNSSGKSSIIQSIKYITQWLNRVETKRGLNEFSAPGLNVYHSDFITENLKYDAIKNSKSKDGVSLGVEYYRKPKSILYPRTDQINELKIDFEKASQIGEIVRLKNLSVNSDDLGKEDGEKFNVIYSDETDAQLTNLRRKYINSYSLGIFEPGSTRQTAENYFPDTLSTYKDDSLHALWSYDNAFKDFIDPIQKLIFTELPDPRNEEGLILNKNGERLQFQKTPFEIIEKAGYQNYYINYFFDYIQQSIDKKMGYENSKKVRSQNKKQFFNELSNEFYENIFNVISKIYNEGYENELADYLNFNIPSGFTQETIEDFALNPYSDAKLTNGLDSNYLNLLKKSMPIKALNEFKKLTTLINNTNTFNEVPDKHAEQRVGTAQTVLMFIHFLNYLFSSKKALDVNKYIDELVSDNDMLTTEGASKSVLGKPVEAIIELQNIIAKAAKEIGDSAFDKAYLKFLIDNQQPSCNCYTENFDDVNHPDGRSLEGDEIVLQCEENPNTSHVYKLTTPEEQKTSTPNEYTKYPRVYFRGLESFKSIDQNLKNFLNEKIMSTNLYDSKVSVDKRIVFYGNLLKKEKNNIDYGKNSKTFINARKNRGMLRERILDIEEREKMYESRLQDLEEEMVALKFEFKTLKGNLSKDLSSEDRNLLNKDLQATDKSGHYLEQRMNSASQNLEIIRSEKKKLLQELNDIENKLSSLSKSVDLKKLDKLSSFFDTTYVPITGYESKTISISELARDIKFLNNGRNPSLKESPGVFNENLTVGKYGGLLPSLMFTIAEELIDPFLFPSVSSEPPFDRSFEELDWHFLGHSDFIDSFNSWVSYLEMEISQVESVMDGPNPLLKVTGKDNQTRNIFEVGSGVAQVLPVIAICLLAKPGEVVCIEEPESNLHPSAQAYLADFLLSMAASGRQIIIETHSPNIIDRVRLRKAHKKSWKKLKNIDWLATSRIEKNYLINQFSDFLEPRINIIFAEQSSGGNSEYREAVLDNNGDIIFDGSSEELWPKGFFDNTQEELSNILKARIYSEEE